MPLSGSDKPNPEKMQAICTAAEAGDVEQVRALLKQDSRLLNGQDAEGLTPLHYAANDGHVWVAHLLLTEGAEASPRTSSGLTPLHIAAAQGYAKVAEVLLAHGAEINSQTNDGVTPLSFAASRVLPLHEGSKKGKSEVADILRRHGGRAE
jgi:ankyrin repeat protein